MGKKSKFYVVWEGHRPGIYDNWNDCQSQVSGYPGARYQSFKSRRAAERAYKEGPPSGSGQKKNTARNRSVKKDIIIPSWSVDAACSGNPGDMEYRGVETASGDELFRMGPFPDGTNNVGEFLALVHAIAMIHRADAPDLPIYSDSQVALKWVRDKKAKTQLKRTGRNDDLFLLIKRAEQWLENHSFQSQLLKWNTRKWGEIPADFGRK